MGSEFDGETPEEEGPGPATGTTVWPMTAGESETVTSAPPRLERLFLRSFFRTGAGASGKSAFSLPLPLTEDGIGGGELRLGRFEVVDIGSSDSA